MISNTTEAKLSPCGEYVVFNSCGEEVYDIWLKGKTLMQILDKVIQLGGRKWCDKATIVDAIVIIRKYYRKNPWNVYGNQPKKRPVAA